jgi:hypothetical protein
MANQTVPSLVELLYRQGFFRVERTLAETLQMLAKLGAHPSPQNLNYALKSAKFLTLRGKPGNRRYIQSQSPSSISRGQDILPPELTGLLAKNFKEELSDLRHNFGVSGTCTAFLIRKILEKLIFLVFSKHGDGSKLLDSTGKLVGLQTMLTLATTLKAKGTGKPYLMQKTADLVAPIKFLGDTAAHNPLANVHMKVIEREMTYVITAYSELASFL